ncbi:MAG: DUF2752 domain-containing protein [Clostridia bacterium]|nr:DUF2752 domain-containing protein [Clostridia bacterium]
MIPKISKIKNYIYVNITMLLLSLYVIFFPFFAKLLSLISPTLTTCTYKKMMGKDCPLCGGTRYIANLSKVVEDPTYLIHPFGFMILFVLFELIFRIVLMIKIKKNTVKNIKSVVLFDIIIHIIAFISFVIYEIVFLLNS